MAEDKNKKTPLKPGFASREAVDETEDKEFVSNLAQGRMGKAHYQGMGQKEAEKTWTEEAICVTCLSAPMCVVARNCGDAKIVVSRCLAYIPSAG